MSAAAVHFLERPIAKHYPKKTLDSWTHAAGWVVTLVVGVVFELRPRDFLLTGRWEVGLAINAPAGCGCSGWARKRLARVRSSCGAYDQMQSSWTPQQRPQRPSLFHTVNGVGSASVC